MRLQILVPTALSFEATKAAQRQGMTVSQWVRQLVEQAVVKHQTSADPVKALAKLRAPISDIEGMLRDIEKGRGLQKTRRSRR